MWQIGGLAWECVASSGNAIVPEQRGKRKAGGRHKVLPPAARLVAGKRGQGAKHSRVRQSSVESTVASDFLFST
jgi:hypothetical protein